MAKCAIYTVGHSTHSAEEFIEMLKAHSIELVVDVRTVPKSRHVPHFNTDALAKTLRSAGIDYTHMKQLGGLRHARKDSPNPGWRNESFRGYADYMQTDEFAMALDVLIAIAGQHRTAIMCAEAVPWRCHRSLIADALVELRGCKVFNIMSASKANEHMPTKFAKKRRGKLVYPSEDDLLV